jgi:hypothetical protein
MPTTAVINSFSDTDTLTAQTRSSTAKGLKQPLYSVPAPNVSRKRQGFGER